MTDLTLVRTCEACPEQYDVMRGEECVGYLRLRHGHFAAHLYGPGGPVVYEASPAGDGIFEWHERDYYLDMALARIDAVLGAPLSGQWHDEWGERPDAA